MLTKKADPTKVGAWIAPQFFCEPKKSRRESCRIPEDFSAAWRKKHKQLTYRALTALTQREKIVSSGREQCAERAVIFSSGKEKPQGILSDSRGFFCRMTEKAQAIDVPGTDGADENKETGEDNVRRAHSPV